MCGRFPVPRQNPGPKARLRQDSRGPGLSAQAGTAFSLPGWAGWRAPPVDPCQVSWLILPPSGLLGSPRAWGPRGREGPRVTKAAVPLLVGGPYDSSKTVATFRPETSRPTNMVPSSFHQPWSGRSQLPQLPAWSGDGPAPQHSSLGPFPSTSISRGGRGVPGHTPAPDLDWPNVGVFTTRTSCELGASGYDLEVLGAWGWGCSPQIPPPWRGPLRPLHSRAAEEEPEPAHSRL